MLDKIKDVRLDYKGNIIMKDYVKDWIEEHGIDNEDTIASLVCINNSLERKIKEELEEKVKTATLEMFGKQPIF